MISERDWPSLASEFIDDGQCRYIEVEGATSEDWKNVLHLLHSHGEVISFEVDGNPQAVPRDAAQIGEYLANSSVEARVQIAGVMYEWFIQVPTLISFSLLPTIRTSREFASMCRFIELLSLATEKCVEVNLEGVSPIGTFAGPGEGFVWFTAGGASAH